MTNIKSENNPSTINNTIDKRKYVLIGNPNVGKSVLFNALTGVYVEVSNYPGTTVDISYGQTKDVVIIDTPGVYGISDYNEEEIVARDILLKNKYVINIVSAVSLERDLFLTQQLIDMGYSIILVVNQIDEAKAKGLKIDFNKLENLLGIRVFQTIATKKQGIETLNNNILSAKEGNKVPDIEKLIENNNSYDLSNHEILLALEGDSSIAKKYPEIKIIEQKENIYNIRRTYINSIVEQCVGENIREAGISTKIGHWLLEPWIGSIVALLVITALYQLIGVFVAGYIVGITESIVNNFYVPWVSKLIFSYVSVGWLAQLLAGKFGMLTMTVQYLVGVLLPLVIGFYFFFSILEDSGYLPRLAVLCDRFLTKFGLNGKAIIPIILGFGCVTMAIISSRTLDSNRERIIAVAILALTVPCSAQFAIIIALLAATGASWAWGVYIITIVGIMLTVSALLNKFLPGESTGSIFDLPPIRLPDIKNVTVKSLNKTWLFILEATPLFILGTFILGVLSITGSLEKVQDALTPLVVNFLDLPKETTNAFLMGLIRRDIGAAGLAQLAGLGGSHSIMTPIQIVVSLVVITLFVPCLAALIVIFKERGWFETAIIWSFSIILAFSAGGLLSFILNIVF